MLFTHNKTPKVFCLTFGVHVTVENLFFSVQKFILQDAVRGGFHQLELATVLALPFRNIG